MKIVALEEHMVIAQVLEAWSAAGVAWEDPGTQSEEGVIARRLAGVGEQRVRDMDAIGVDVQVLSLTTPGVQNLAPADAVRLAPEVNDAIAEVEHAPAGRRCAGWRTGSFSRRVRASC